MNRDEKIEQRLMNELKKLEGKRQPWLKVWQEAYELVDPTNAYINTDYSSAIFDGKDLLSTAAQRARGKFIAALQSTVTPPNERWHRLIAPNKTLAKKDKVASWLENLTDALFELRYRAAAGFNKAIIKIWDRNSIIGLGVMFVDEDAEGNGMNYRAVHPKDFYAVLGADGSLKKCFNKMKLQGWEVIERLEAQDKSAEKTLPRELWQRIKDDNQTEVKLVHVVVKLSTKEVEKTKIDFKRKDGTIYTFKPRYKSYLLLDDMNKPLIIEESHFFSCPYQFLRFNALDNDIYSSSPTIDALPEIRMLQRIRKSVIESAEKAVDPPLLARREAAMGGIVPIAGAIIPGTLDAEGRELLKPLQTGDATGVGVEIEELITKAIEDYYLVPLYMMFYQEGKMTATEINQRAMERAMMMSIKVFPIENELLSPMVMRELDIMQRQGKLPEDMPKELKELMNAGDPYCAIQYEGEQHKAQELIKANGIAQTLQIATGLSAFDKYIPAAFKTYDCLKTLTAANNMPLELLLTNDEYEGEKQKLQEREQAAALSAINPSVADVAGDVSKGYNSKLNNGAY